MSDKKIYRPGEIAWVDLTVPQTEEIRNFYQQVVGWKSTEVDMGGYLDYCVYPDAAATNETPVAGICHKRGGNAQLPSYWLVYIVVAHLEESVAECERLGGKVVDGPHGAPGQRFFVIQDPAGAYVALLETSG